MHLVTVFWNENIRINGYGAEQHASQVHMLKLTPSTSECAMFGDQAFKKVIKVGF